MGQDQRSKLLIRVAIDLKYLCLAMTVDTLDDIPFLANQSFLGILAIDILVVLESEMRFGIISLQCPC